MIPPDGWNQIPPSEAKPGDGVWLPDGSIHILDERMFEPISIELRRLSWAIRQVGE